MLHTSQCFAVRSPQLQVQMTEALEFLHRLLLSLWFFFFFFLNIDKEFVNFISIDYPLNVTYWALISDFMGCLFCLQSFVKHFK